MKKIQAWVKYSVEVEIEVEDNATEEEIMKLAEQEADEQWSSNAEVDDIDYCEI
jgi:hypothetical protein